MVQRTAMRQMDVAVGKVVYTPVLSPGGGFKSDLTIMRLGDQHFRDLASDAKRNIHVRVWLDTPLGDHVFRNRFRDRGRNFIGRLSTRA